MQRILLFLTVSFLSCLALATPSLMAQGEKPHVLVTVAPYRWLLEQIAGDEIACDEIVPAGASSHTWEISPKQAMQASQACIWFTIGESFEARAIKALQASNPKLQIVDLRLGIELIAESSHCQHHCHSHSQAAAQDIHLWLSPSNLQKQAKIIAATLQQAFPHLGNQIASNQTQLLKKLAKLDGQISQLLAPFKGRSLFVSHPAYAYFCRDYHLIQVPVESEGKDPTPHYLTHLIQEAKKHQIHTLFVQPQYSQKGAERIAQQTCAKIKVLDPYREQVADNLLEIAEAFSLSFASSPPSSL